MSPERAVSVLQIHGTADTTINYMGGMIQNHPYPSAATSVLDWATFDGCATTPDAAPPPLSTSNRHSPATKRR
jgi:polyhydroxybutyrate depolymerase